MPRRWLPLLLCCTAALALPFPAPQEVDSDESRRVLGSSVVTSVSVIMDLGNGTKTYFADAAGRPVSKPSVAAMVGSPAGLLAPDRYEFYTFDEAGDLVKRFMTLGQIQSIIAGGEGQQFEPDLYRDRLPGETLQDTGTMGVRDVVASVQNVLKSELEATKHKPPAPIMTPPMVSSDSASSWSVILPSIFGGSSSSSESPPTTTTTASTPSSTTTTTASSPPSTTTTTASTPPTTTTTASTPPSTTTTTTSTPPSTTTTTASTPPSTTTTTVSTPLSTTSTSKRRTKPTRRTTTRYTTTSTTPAPTTPQHTEPPTTSTENVPIVSEDVTIHIPTPEKYPSTSEHYSVRPLADISVQEASSTPEVTLPPYSGTPSLLPSNTPGITLPPYSGTPSLLPSNTPEGTLPPYSGTPSLLPSTTTESVILPNEDITLRTTEKSTTVFLRTPGELPIKEESQEQQNISESENPTHGVYPSLSDTLESIIKDAIAQDFGSSTVESITETSASTPSSLSGTENDGQNLDLSQSLADEDQISGVSSESTSIDDEKLPASEPETIVSQSLADEDQIPQMSVSSSESVSIDEEKLPVSDPETIVPQEFSQSDTSGQSLSQSQDTLSTFQQSSDVYVEQTTALQELLTSRFPQQPPITSFSQKPVATLALDLAPPFLDSEIQHPDNEEQILEQTKTPVQDNLAGDSDTSSQRNPIDNFQVTETNPQGTSGSDYQSSIAETSQNIPNADSQTSVTLPSQDVTNPSEYETFTTNTDNSYVDDSQIATTNLSKNNPSIDNSQTLITSNSQDTPSADNYQISTISSQDEASNSDPQILLTSDLQNTPSSDEYQTLTTIQSQDDSYSDETQELKANTPQDALSSNESQIITNSPQTVPAIDTLTTKYPENNPSFDNSQTLTTNPSQDALSTDNIRGTTNIPENWAQTDSHEETSSPLYEAISLEESSTLSSLEEAAIINDSSDKHTDVEYTTANPPVTDGSSDGDDAVFSTDSVSNVPEISNTESNVLGTEALQDPPESVISESVEQNNNTSNIATLPDSPASASANADVSSIKTSENVDAAATEQTTAAVASDEIASQTESVLSNKDSNVEPSGESVPANTQDASDDFNISQELAESLTSVLSQVADQDTATTILDDINANGFPHDGGENAPVTTTTPVPHIPGEHASLNQKIEIDTVAELLDTQPITSRLPQQTSSTEATSPETAEKDDDTVTTLADEVAVTTEAIDTNTDVPPSIAGGGEIGLNREPDRDQNVEAIEKDIEKEDISNEAEDDGVVKRQDEKVDETGKFPNKVESNGVGNNSNNEDLATKPQAVQVVSLQTSPIVYEDEETYNAHGAALDRERATEKSVISVSSSQSVVSSKLDTSAEQKEVLDAYSTNGKEGMDVVNDSNGGIENNAAKEAPFGLKLINEENQENKSSLNQESVSGVTENVPTTEYPEIIESVTTRRDNAEGSAASPNNAGASKPSVMLLPPIEDENAESPTEGVDVPTVGYTDAPSDLESDDQEVTTFYEPEDETSTTESDTKDDAITDQTTVLIKSGIDDGVTPAVTVEAGIIDKGAIPGETTLAAESIVSGTEDKEDESIESSETLYDPTEVNTESIETEKPEEGNINTESPTTEEARYPTSESDNQEVTDSVEVSTDANVLVKDALTDEGTDKGESGEPVSTTLPSDPSSSQDSTSNERVETSSESVSIVIKGAVNTGSNDGGSQASSALVKDSSHYPVDQGLKDSAHDLRPFEPQRPQYDTPVDLRPAPQENIGLEASTAGLSGDVRKFADLCNELAFRLWTAVTVRGLNAARSVVMSPIGLTSILAMVFLGARGPTSGQMNDILRLDDMVTFNPHQVFMNVTDSVVLGRNPGVATAAFVRELYSDKTKGKLLDFYKERAQQFYEGHVEEVGFNMISDILRRRTNLLVKRQTRGKVAEYLRGSNIMLHPPLAAFSANIFQTDCNLASTEGRDGEMYFTVLPSSRQRRLVPVPAAVWRSGFMAGYEPSLDATAVALGGSEGSLVSLVLLLPGQQGQVAPGDGLGALERRLLEPSFRRGAWSRVLRCLSERAGLELQLPRFSHRSLLNLTSALQRMGLKDLFSAERADLRGLNGVPNDLHLSDVVQVNTFSTCAEDSVGARHHVEVYPSSPQPQRTGRDDVADVPLALRPRQARLPENPRLRYDRPFLYFVRHNPTGFILHMGRFNPHLLH